MTRLGDGSTSTTAVAADQAPKPDGEPTAAPAATGQPPITPIPGAGGQPQSNAGGTTTYASATGNDAAPIKLVVSNSAPAGADAALPLAAMLASNVARFDAATSLAQVRQAA